MGSYFICGPAVSLERTSFFFFFLLHSPKIRSNNGYWCILRASFLWSVLVTSSSASMQNLFCLRILEEQYFSRIVSAVLAHEIVWITQYISWENNTSVEKILHLPLLKRKFPSKMVSSTSFLFTRSSCFKSFSVFYVVLFLPVQLLQL